MLDGFPTKIFRLFPPSTQLQRLPFRRSYGRPWRAGDSRWHPCPPRASGTFQNTWRGGTWLGRELLHRSLSLEEAQLTTTAQPAPRGHLGSLPQPLWNPPNRHRALGQIEEPLYPRHASPVPASSSRVKTGRPHPPGQGLLQQRGVAEGLPDRWGPSSHDPLHKRPPS